MKETLVPDLQHQASYKVTADMSPRHLPVVVLSTPSMVRLIEETCLESVVRHLDEDETTVGTHVCVSHTGVANEGEEVTVRARLSGVERRRLNFAVEVISPRGVISEGTHQRAVVDSSRFR